MTRLNLPLWAFLTLLINPIVYAATQTQLSAIPVPVSNNGVVQVKVNSNWYWISFSGLGTNKGYQDVHNRTFAFDVSKNKWLEKSPVPIAKPINGLVGRLASVATAIDETAYVFGGYTVAKDHSEVSVPDVYAYHVLSDKYQALAPMPVPVDDTIALPYNNRYIYLISGWHNDGNVNLVQVYDTKTDKWQQASPFPGKAVFGHAGGIVDNTILVCDGVRVDVHLNKRRSYAAETACYRGEIDSQTPHKIAWFKVEHPTGESRYRMAAKGIVSNTNNKEIVFIGGSNNPYNYNGIGYNGMPSEPSDQIWRYNIKAAQWLITTTDTATMDHRALLELNGELFTLGGMGKKQQVLNTINRY